MKPCYKAIAAMAANRVIGRNNQLPWHLPEDLRWFKKITLGHTVVMGRRTFDSIGRPLPKRKNIVLTRSPEKLRHSGIHVVDSIAALAKFATADPIFVIGGAAVYQALLPHCEELYLTHVKQDVAGDTYFPAFAKDFIAVETLEETPALTIIRYLRKATAQEPPTV